MGALNSTWSFRSKPEAPRRMRASLVVLDADRRRQRHALQHLQHHTQGLFPLFPRTITSVFLKLYGYFPLFPLKTKNNFFETNRYLRPVESEVQSSFSCTLNPHFFRRDFCMLRYTQLYSNPCISCIFLLHHAHAWRIAAAHAPGSGRAAADEH